MNGFAQNSKPTESAHQFLDEVYQSLGYHEGELLDATSIPYPDGKEENVWVEKGDWLALANKVGAEKVFFVNDDPVIVFWEFEVAPTENELLDTFRRVWCMARPQRLFIALPGELQVYSLNQAIKDNRGENIKPLITIKQIADVKSKLNAYRREFLESGYLPEDDRFGSPDERADRRLIQDLKAVRKSLINAGLTYRHAHALIGRSIFIRYLEDRGILTAEYFEQVAAHNAEWLDLLSQTPEKPDIIEAHKWEKRHYYNVLRNKEFTYALFDQLTHDFNGDIFPKDESEKEAIEQPHLDLLRGFLLGDTGPQRALFFWAYDFEIIPIELISNIYEEFYHTDNKDDKGTHYTPSVLVEYVLSQVLPAPRLATNPKILDPACGSGIFLVEAFRRIVRYRVRELGRTLSLEELRHILRNQIVGIEVNEEATYIAAFSLYLALLNYQEPPDILAQINLNPNEKPLPHLVFDTEYSQDKSHYNILFNTNTFGLMQSEREQLERKLKASSRFKGRIEVERLYESPASLPLQPHSFDVIIGNPPWGFKKGATAEVQEAQKQAQRWCEVFGWSIGDKELSQAFIARTLSLLKPDGECGLLVSTGVLLKHHENSIKFRQRWLEESTIKSVVNFSHVRHIFFSEAIAPFAFVHYKASPADSMHRVYYWSAKKTQVVDNMQSVILNRSDLRLVRQNDLQHNEALWKIYWWGSHRDAALINVLGVNTSLEQLADKDKDGRPVAGRGFEGDFKTGDHNPSNWLKDFKELPIENFQRYGAISDAILETVPDLVHRRGNRNIYSGWRLLIKRGINQKSVPGWLETRLENRNYCFRNSIHGVKVDNAEEWKRKILIGILWSSLARYFYFMTASSWGTWHHEIHLEEVMHLPIRFPEDLELRERIVNIVDQLRSWNPVRRTFFAQEGKTDEEIEKDLAALEKKLDEAIFELYELIEPERDLVLDMCEVGLEFFYREGKSQAVQAVDPYPECSQDLLSDLPRNREQEKGLEGYLYAFLQSWNRELEPKGEFYWRIIRPPHVPMLAVTFSTHEKGKSLPKSSVAFEDEKEWVKVLKQCDELEPISRRIYIDGIVRVVTDTDIFIIKRNERRLWTRSIAREDAEATLLQAMRLRNQTISGNGE